VNEDYTVSERGLRRFFVKPEDVHNTTAYIRGSEAHHMSRVIRLKDGDRCELFDGSGHGYVAVLSSVKGQTIEAIIESKLPALPVKKYNVSIAQAVPQRQTFDTIIEKATELGVGKIIPLYTKRTINKCTHSQHEKRAIRWQSISIQAAKQSKQNVVPVIESPQTIAQLSETLTPYTVVLVPTPGARLSIQYVSTLITKKIHDNKNIPEILLIIGPEGGIAEAELAALTDKEIVRFSLGATILKADTAMIACVSIINYCCS